MNLFSTPKFVRPLELAALDPSKVGMEVSGGIGLQALAWLHIRDGDDLFAHMELVAVHADDHDEVSYLVVGQRGVFEEDETLAEALESYAVCLAEWAFDEEDLEDFYVGLLNEAASALASAALLADTEDEEVRLKEFSEDLADMAAKEEELWARETA